MFTCENLCKKVSLRKNIGAVEVSNLLSAKGDKQGIHQQFSIGNRHHVTLPILSPKAASKGVPTLDGARGKKQVWRPHVRT